MIYDNIGDLSNFKSRGNISAHINTNVLQNALQSVENAYLRKWMGGAYTEADQYPKELQERLCDILAQLAEAYLIVNSNNITRFGAVIKENGDQSTPYTARRASGAASVLRLQAITAMKNLEQEVTAAGFKPFGWCKETNVLKLHFL